MFALAGLFLAAFVAATLLPAQSELVLGALLIAGDWPPALLIGVASLGNVLGSLVNWGVGRWLIGFADRRWFPFSARQIETATRHYRRFGWPSLLASWVPVIGDPLTLIAGALREPLWRFLLVVTLAKTGRYIVLAAAVLAAR